jgi:hypothetical protein
VNTLRRANFYGLQHVLLCVRKIHDAHVAVPGLAVVKVAAADDETTSAVHELLAARCAMALADARCTAALLPEHAPRARLVALRAAATPR